jgi:phosphoribosylamine---glycine ligase
VRILVIGGGGREHAMVHALAASPRVKKLWCAPGNAGIAREAECVPIQSDNIRALLAFAQENKVDLTMVGPEAPLVDGLVDYFRAQGMVAIGPTKSAARLEGSKSFAKQFMQKYGIATAKYEVIPNLMKGTYQLTHWKERSVVKADGLAAGKGVKVCQNQDEAKQFIYDIMEKEIFGSAGSTVVIEECLEGQEATVMAFCDGRTLVAMPASQDHKRLSDGDEGPNTGGMGAYAPAPCVTPALLRQIEQDIFKPFLRGIQAEGFDYRGIIYFGIMLTSEGPKVLEFNVRFGDPETQTVLPLLETDLVQVLEAIVGRTLQTLPIQWKDQFSLCVVLASHGYPGAYDKGKTIRGLSAARPGIFVYHAGTQARDKEIVTSGGRVLGVTGLGNSLEAAKRSAYEGVSSISYEGMIFRKDIGARAIPVSGRAG